MDEKEYWEKMHDTIVPHEPETSISKRRTASQVNSMTKFCFDRPAVVRFVKENLSELTGGSPSIMTIEPEKSGGYYVSIVTDFS